MPHRRTRHLTKLLSKTLSFSPIAGLLGHRQVGKTTLASEFGLNYYTMDVEPVRERVSEGPIRFLEQNRASPLVIDECQLVPAVFPALKEMVRRHPRPNQYLLTGSVRFTSRKAIRESLTGRIVTWELLPMDLAEIDGRSLPDSIPRLLEASTAHIELRGKSKAGPAQIRAYLEKGGLPGVFAVRSEAIRAQRFDTQIETLLDRDLRLVSLTTLNYRSIRQLAVFLANRQGQPFEYAEAMRATRISVPTLRKLLAAFEAIFLIRVIPTEGGEKRPVVYFEDQGEATRLQTMPATVLEDFERFLYANLRTQWHYRPELGIRLTQYRTRGGAYVPFVLKSKRGTLGILPLADEGPTPQAIGSAASFLKKHPKAKVIYVHTGIGDQSLGHDQRILGCAALL